MSRHPETNPHFVRPIQQAPRGGDRDRGRRSTPPPPISGSGGGSATPLPHHHREEFPHHRDRGRGGRSTPPPVIGSAPATPPPDHHQPEGENHFPIHIPPPHHDENVGQRPNPLGRGGHFQSPWAIPPPRPTQAHHPTHGGHYQSPWIPPPSAHPADDRGPLVTQPHRHDEAEHSQPHSPPPQAKHPRHHHRDGRKQHRPTNPTGAAAVTTPPPQSSEGHRRGRGPVVPSPRKTKISTWFAAVCCAIFWIAIFLAGIIILVVYLVYRPHNPRFEVSDATLNTAYLDAGSLLNADVSLLANFTNPNRKVGVDFGNLIVDLYYGSTLIATQFIQPFAAERSGSRFVNLELVTSQVRIPLEESKKLEEEINRNTVTFTVKGVFRVRSQLGSFLAYSYKLYGQCTIVLTGPPSGVLRGRRCITKR